MLMHIPMALEENENKSENSPMMINSSIQHNFLNMENLNSTLRIIEVRIEFIQIGEVDTMNEKFQAIVKTKAKWYENSIIAEYDKRALS